MKCNEFFKTYLAFIPTLSTAQEWPALSGLLDLCLKELTESTFAGIFPRRAFFAQSGQL